MDVVSFPWTLLRTQKYLDKLIVKYILCIRNIKITKKCGPVQISFSNSNWNSKNDARRFRIWFPLGRMYYFRFVALSFGQKTQGGVEFRLSTCNISERGSEVSYHRSVYSATCWIQCEAFFLWKRQSKRALESPDGKWSPPPTTPSNTRGAKGALPAFKVGWAPEPGITSIPIRDAKRSGIKPLLNASFKCRGW